MSGSVYWYICAASANVPTVSPNDLNFNRAAANAITALRRSQANVGDLLPRPIAKPVADHLLCDGSAVDRAAYPQLFAEIGTEWGAGDGATTFNLPNLLGTAIPNAVTAPEQTVTDSGTSNTGGTVTQPTQPSQTGGTTGGEVSSGGRVRSFKPVLE